MSEIILSMWAIAAVFLLVAIAYASVGLGGGSSYAALMVVFGFSSLSIPNLSLLLNLLVTTVSCFNFIRRGHLRINLIAPFLVLSLPMAWLGGTLQVPEQVFRLLMALSLVVVLVRIYAWNNTAIAHRFSRGQVVLIALALGAVLGFLAGVIGIGGGIFLVPAILLLGLGDMKQAAACGVVFVCLNSLAGLISRSQYNFVDFSNYLPLIVAVLLGGTIGSLIGSSRIDSRSMEKVLGLVIAVAVVLLLRSLLTA
ncbi:MAG: sulfite exporter TauE/SafE family protein [Gammaproteobacteria bacterium]|nr:sulfite exporter TauE/SafE family protein [Gammaproteobacteria bacterium]